MKNCFFAFMFPRCMKLAALLGFMLLLTPHRLLAEVDFLDDWEDFNEAVASLYAAQGCPWMIYPAGPFGFILHPSPQPFDPDGFPGLTNAVSPGAILGVPCWRLRVMETQLSQRVWITFADATPLRTNAVPAGYSPSDWVRQAYGAPPVWLSGETLDDWYRERDRSRFELRFTLLTQEAYTNYEAVLAARSNAAPDLVSGPRMPEDTNAIAFAAIDCLPDATPEIWLYSPTNDLPIDLFDTKELTPQPTWALSGTLNTHVPFTAWTAALGVGAAFFTFSRADVDTDDDGIADGRERLFFRTNPESADSDGDGIGDFAELFTLGTDGALADSDGDGLADGAEWAHIEVGSAGPWYDVSGGSNVLAALAGAVDDGLLTLPLPFPVYFDGLSRTQLTISVNGAHWLLTPGKPAPSPSGIFATNLNMSNTVVSADHVFVAGYWDDLKAYPAQLGSAITLADVATNGSRYCVLEYLNMGLYNYPAPLTNHSISLQIVLPAASSNRIEVGFRETHGLHSYTVIEFPTPNSGLASPVNRLDPGFVGGGRTAGGAREFVLPNGPLPPGATIRRVP